MSNPVHRLCMIHESHTLTSQPILMHWVVVLASCTSQSSQLDQWRIMPFYDLKEFLAEEQLVPCIDTYLPWGFVHINGCHAPLRESPWRVLPKGSSILIHSLSGAWLMFVLPVDTVQSKATEKLHCVNAATGAVVPVWLVVYLVAVAGDVQVVKPHILMQSRLHEKCIHWRQFSCHWSDKLFHHHFHMDHCSFSKLCMTIQQSIGAKEFKSEKYLLSTALQHHAVDACDSVGGLICGERKLALFLCYLAGGSYLDVADICNIHKNSLFHIFWEVVDWINPWVNPFPLITA